MSEGFSGDPLTRWNGARNMVLEEDFYYIDPKGKQWNAPKGSAINGATIPRALWTTIGSPFAGHYRRASIVHDVAVDEEIEIKLRDAQRKEADRMFYHACRHEGCSKRLAVLLYIGVSLGTWASSLSSVFKSDLTRDEDKLVKDNIEDKNLNEKFWKIVEESEKAIKEEDLDAIDTIINKNLQSTAHE